MSLSRRLSQSIAGSWLESVSPGSISGPELEDNAKEWTNAWKSVLARDLIDSKIVVVDGDLSVEDACEMLTSEDIPCLLVKANQPGEDNSRYHGLFDFSDVNAFLTLAATRHTFSLDDTNLDPRRDNIIAAAKAGRVPVHLVCNLSDKNPLIILPYDATVISLLEVFSRGTHKVLLRVPDNSEDVIGVVSDRGLLAWFASYAKATPTFTQYLANPIQPLSLPSLKIYASVIAATSTESILDAMKLMSEEGVSSVAVLDDETGALLSAVSVTDVGKVVAPSQSNLILNTPLHQFISYVKDPDGSTDGVDKYPVYSVLPSSQLQYTIEKLLATNAHRLFVTRESTLASPVLSPTTIGNLCGIVSVVDILALFAHLAGIPNVDPTEMQRHRRMSSASSRNGENSFIRSRSSSKSSVRQSPTVVASSAAGLPNPSRNSITGLDAIVPLQSVERRRSLRTNRA